MSLKMTVCLLYTSGPYSDNIPNMGFALFQMMFAIITPSLITGAVAGRMKFKAIFLFVFLWQFVVYYPMAHMVWGGGFLAQIGSIDVYKRQILQGRFRFL